MHDTSKRIDAAARRLATPTTSSQTGKRKSTPRSKRTSALLPYPERACACGCLGAFIPTRRDQKFISREHRFKTYKMHVCDSCGVSHRMGVKMQKETAE